MNISEMVGAKLPEIKKLLFSETTEEAFVDAKLVDGTIIRYESLEIGATLSVVGEDGEIVSAPDGQHELESGEIVRTEEGIIVEILEPEAEEVEEEAEDEKEEEMSAEAPAFDADSFKEELLGAVSNLIKSEIDAASFAKNDKVSDIEKAVSLMTELVEKMAATPKEAPSKKVANPFGRGTDYTELASKISAVMKEQNK
tara:strand:- start:814 stop:1410 length:597 start_codon:yes stop_codon:yes gene_type:complete